MRVRGVFCACVHLLSVCGRGWLRSRWTDGLQRFLLIRWPFISSTSNIRTGAPTASARQHLRTLCARERAATARPLARADARVINTSGYCYTHITRAQHHTPHFVATIASAAPRLAHPAHTLTHPRFAPTTAAPAPTSHPPTTHHTPPPPPPLHRTRRPHPAPATDAINARNTHGHIAPRAQRAIGPRRVARAALMFLASHTHAPMCSRGRLVVVYFGVGCRASLISTTPRWFGS